MRIYYTFVLLQICEKRHNPTSFNKLIFLISTSRILIVVVSFFQVLTQ